MKAAYPTRYNMVAGYSEFFRSHLYLVFILNRILPKKVFTQDFGGMRAMHSIIKQNGVVAFAPEGMSSIYGTNQPVVPGTGKFLKHYGIPVYFLKMRGQYLTSTKHFLEIRKGRTEAELSLETKIVMDADLLDEVGAVGVLWDAMATAIEDEASYKKAYYRIKNYYRINKPKIRRCKTDAARAEWTKRMQLIESYIFQLEKELF